jgi:hypothetical protein
MSYAASDAQLISAAERIADALATLR